MSIGSVSSAPTANVAAASNNQAQSAAQTAKALQEQAIAEHQASESENNRVNISA